MRGAEISSIYKVIQDRVPVFYAWYELMHTRLDVVLCHKTEKAARAVAGRVYEMIQTLSHRLNRFDPQSDLWRINNFALTEPVPLDPEIWDIVSDALDALRRTNSFFDIRVDSAEGAYSGDSGIVMEESTRTIRFTRPGIHLDLGGYAKGYALEKAREILFRSDVSDALLSFGNSSVLALGNRPLGEGWSIGVEHLMGNRPAVFEVSLHSESMSTSGNSPRHPVHIYSPLARCYVEGLKMNTVVSDSALESEIFSTALMACRSIEEMKTLVRRTVSVREARYISFDETSGDLTGNTDLFSR